MELRKKNSMVWGDFEQLKVSFSSEASIHGPENVAF